MDSKYDRLFKLAIEQKDAGAIIEVVGYLQEALTLVKSDGRSPAHSFMCLALFYRVWKMMGCPSQDVMTEACEECRELAKGGS